MFTNCAYAMRKYIIIQQVCVDKGKSLAPFYQILSHNATTALAGLENAILFITSLESEHLGCVHALAEP